jgi:hypothetical protein
MPRSLERKLEYIPGAITMTKRLVHSTALAGCVFLVLCHAKSFALEFQQSQGQQPDTATTTSESRAVGKVKIVTGNVVTITTDAGADASFRVSDSTRLLRVEPGQKDLKSAAPFQLQDVQSGDRVLARGTLSADGKTIEAATVVLMKASDVSAKQEHDREDWKQRGVGGLVSAVDSAGQSVTISVPGFNGNKTVKVMIARSTALRRYSPDSVKFDDAKPATFSDIKLGDQLRARGDRSADGAELNAQEIVEGTFRNIAGTVVSTDAAKNTLTVNDLGTKKPIVLTISADSQLRKLSPMVAQRIAMRMKGTAGAADASSAAPSAMQKPATEPAGAPGGGGHAGSTPDFQQMLSRMPAVALTDLQKGDAVMIVSTEGSGSQLPSAVTLLSGVEPILTASPDSSRAAMLLSPWNIGGGGAGDAGGGAPQ